MIVNYNLTPQLLYFKNLHFYGNSISFLTFVTKLLACSVRSSVSDFFNPENISCKLVMHSYDTNDYKFIQQ